jgi:hypothetical protein
MDIRDMQIHRFITFLSSMVLSETRTSAFDLYLAMGLLLNVFHIGATLADHLCAKIETRNRLQVNWDALFRPFSLRR